jgi:hypothetical protein
LRRSCSIRSSVDEIVRKLSLGETHHVRERLAEAVGHAGVALAKRRLNAPAHVRRSARFKQRAALLERPADPVDRSVVL